MDAVTTGAIAVIINSEDPEFRAFLAAVEKEPEGTSRRAELEGNLFDYLARRARVERDKAHTSEVVARNRRRGHDTN